MGLAIIRLLFFFREAGVILIHNSQFIIHNLTAQPSLLPWDWLLFFFREAGVILIHNS